MWGFTHGTSRAEVVLASLLSLLVLPACGATSQPALRNGDIIFHTSRSAQSLAIQQATRSRYSHMGIVFMKGGKPYVFEAISTVRSTPLDEWIRRGEKQEYVVKRLRDADRVLTTAALREMERVGKEYEGRPYDLTFEWGDERLYCSELVWKIYQRATGLEIGRRERLRDFVLSAPAVRAKMKERYPQGPPLNEIVVSPEAMFESDLLVEVERR